MSHPALLRDPLTGAYSRFALETRLVEEVERAGRYGAPLALLLIDLDHFKSINDAFGHVRGDELLRAFVARLQIALRASDLLFRYGGDEFVLLLPATSRAAARVLAERLLALVAEEPFAGAPPLRCGASIGVAACPDDGAAPAALFALSDQRLYEAKRRGRGCVVDEGPSAAGGLDIDDGGRLIERDAAVQAMREFLEALQGQRHGALAISGSHGAGRSRMLLELRHMARLRGYLVALVRGKPGLRTRVFGALDEARQQWPIVPAPDAEPAAMMRLLLEACEQHERTGLLLLVDDLADVDAATLEAVRETLAARAFPVGLAYTALPTLDHRPHEEAPLQMRVELPAFSLAGVRLWLRSALRWEPPAFFCQWLFEQVGGWPGALRRAIERLEEQSLLVAAPGGRALRADFSSGAPFAAGPLSPVPAHSLPELPADFIGRSADIHAIARGLALHPLLTITGPGGIGKTRLALQAASELAPRFADGACFVPLATITSAAGLALAVIAALGLKPPDRADPGAFVSAYLRNKALLLVLDNVEQLRDELGQLASWLRAAPRLRALATSRDQLDLPGEMRWELSGLPFPSDGADAIERYAAGQLFVQHARRVVPHFAMSADDRAAVRAICQLVQGMPLGVELAAAWVGLFSCAEIAHALRTRLDFLAVPPAQQATQRPSLRAVFDYFWGQLSPGEQRVARWLSVFRGGFTREVARDVAGASPFFLSALVHKAFLHRGADGRYTLHELLRQHAAAQLAARPGEQRQASARHAAHYLSFVEEAAPLIRGPEQALFLAQLDAEQSNLRAALEWSLTGEEEAPDNEAGMRGNGEPAPWAAAQPFSRAELGPRLAAALWPYWVYRAQVREARDWLTRLLHQPAAQAPTLWRARLLNAAGFMAMRQGDWGEADAQLAESVALAERHGSHRDRAWALNHCGYAAKAAGDLARAERFQAESLRVARAIGHGWHAAWALSGLGDLASVQRDFARARGLLEEGLALFRQLGDQHGVASLLLGLGQAAIGQGDLPRARSLLEECQQIYAALGDADGLAAVLTHLGQIAQQAGDHARGAALLRQSLALRWDLGDRKGVARCLAGLAGAAVASGQRHRAAWLYGAAASLDGDSQHGPSAACDAEPDDALAVAAGEGWNAGLDAAVRQALAWG